MSALWLKESDLFMDKQGVKPKPSLPDLCIHRAALCLSCIPLIKERKQKGHANCLLH